VSTPDESSEARAIAGFAYELGLLKRISRSGWWQVGVKDPESVADHSARVAHLATIIAAEEGADPARAALLAIWHDAHETRIGDLPHPAKPYLGKPSPNDVVADQTASLPETSKRLVRSITEEFEAQETLESRCARDSDKLECLLQAVEYRESGYLLVQGWIDSSHEALVTETAKKIADAALCTSILAWRGR
jgi:putative hydrolase of HD superfamily